MKKVGRSALRRVLSFAYLFAALLAVASPRLLPAQGDVTTTAAQTASSRSPTRTPPRHAALTVEGGGTLGSYEGGLTWALLEIFRRKRINNLDTAYVRQLKERLGPRVIPMPLSAEAEQILKDLYVFEISATAGASAGSINSFLAANNWCSLDPFETEDRSQFWAVWIPTGWEDLFPRHGAHLMGDTRAGLFQRSAFKSIFRTLDTRWTDSTSYDPNCVVSFGATMTRLAEDSLPVSQRVWARNQRYLAALTIQPPPTLSRGGPRYRNPPSEVSDRIRLGKLVELPLEADGTIDHRHAHDLIKASSGYPLAFDPYRVKYCPAPDRQRAADTAGLKPSTKPKAVVRTKFCSGAIADSSFFVDGGVFDNGPLTLAYGMSLADSANVSLDNLFMLFVNPETRRVTYGKQDVFAARRIVSAEPDPDSVPPGSRFVTGMAVQEDTLRGLDAVSKLLATFVPSARQYELQVAGRYLPAVQEAERLRDSLMANAAAASQNTGLERARADSEYLRRVDAMKAAHAFMDTLAYVRDTLRKALALCRIVPQPEPSKCTVLGEDSLFVLPQSREDSLRASPTLRATLYPDPERVSAYSIRPDTSPIPRFPFDSLLFTSDRWLPLGGEWLFGFGGLMGKPLREYDFYVGVYDGLSLITRYFYCRERPTDECRGRNLGLVIANPPLNISTQGDIVLRAIYRLEYGQEFSLPARASVVDTSVETRILLALVDAMGSRMGKVPLSQRSCQKGGRIEKIACAQGMERVFKTLVDRAGPSVLAVYPSGCSDDARSNKKCFVDPLFVELVNDPNTTMNRLAGELLARVSFATPSSSGLKLPITMANAVYLATNERARQGWDAGSVSLPPKMSFMPRLITSAIPSSFGVTMGMSGWYYEWALRKHVNASYALGGAARVVWRSRLRRPDERAHFRHFVPSFRAERKFGGGVAPLVSTLGAEVSYWDDFLSSQFSDDWNGTTLGLTSALFAQRLRVSLYRRPSKYKTASKGRPAVFFTVGVGDINGTAYWLVKMIQHARAQPGE